MCALENFVNRGSENEAAKSILSLPRRRCFCLAKASALGDSLSQSEPIVRSWASFGSRSLFFARKMWAPVEVGARAAIVSHVVSPMGTDIGFSLFWRECPIEELDETQFLRKGSIASLRPSPRKL